MKTTDSILELIGKTPLLKLDKRIIPEDAADVYVKLESFNVGGSVKDRTALSMIEKAEKRGLITPGKTILADCTSGNTGIGEAVVAAAKGYKLVIVMNELASEERKKILKALGVKLILAPAGKGIQGDFEVFDKVVEENGYFAFRQFENPDNPAAHYETTGPEIEEQLGKIPDVFVATAGTGGTFSGTAKYLKERDKNVKTYAVEPKASAVLNGGKPGPHKIAGIGPGIIPKTLDRSLIDKVIDISDEESWETVRELAKTGLLVGPSSGAAIFAAKKIAEELGKGKTVVTIAPDSGERYLSTDLFG